MKIPGIIGGLGPETTADFYLKINHMAEEAMIENRPACLVWNIPLPYALERKLLLTQTGLEKYIPYLRSAAKILEVAGADFLAVPCNTVHEVYEDYSSAVEIPVLHIVDEAVDDLELNKINDVALLATGQTIGSGMYQKRLEDRGIDYMIPDEEDQQAINQIVSRLVGSEKNEEDSEWMHSFIEHRVRGVGAILLACTDLHILTTESNTNIKVVDTMETLARATFTLMTKGDAIICAGEVDPQISTH